MTEESPPAPRTRAKSGPAIRDSFIFKLVSLNLWYQVTAGIVAMAVPLYALSLKATTVQMGFVGAAPWVGTLLMALPAGRLFDEFRDWRMLLVIGIVTYAVAVLALALAHSLWLLTVIALLEGGAFSLGHVTLSTTFLNNLHVFGEAKAGWHKATVNTGFAFLGPLLGAYTTRWVGFAETFVLIGLLTLALAAGVYLTRRGRLTGNPRPRLKVSRFVSVRQVDLATFFRNKVLVQISIIEGVTGATLAIIATFVPVLVLRELHIAAYYAGWIVAAEGLAYVLTLFLGGGALKKCSSRTQYISGSLLAVVSLFVLGATSNLALLMVGSVLLGVGLGAIGFANFTLFAGLDGQKGAMFGFYGICLGAFSIFGPLAGSLIGRSLGIQAVFWAMMPLFGWVAAYSGRTPLLSPR